MLSIPTQSISQVQPRLRGQQFIKQPDYQHPTVASVTPRTSEIHAKELGVWRAVWPNAKTEVLVAHAVNQPTIDMPLPAHINFLEKTRETSLPPPILRSSTYEPRTKLGRKLWGLRLRVTASGARLLDWDEIEQEVAERRESARAIEE
jgi:hypothetical protein